MASYNELIALIDAFIKRNGVQAITGQILNGVLKAMVDQVGRGYAIMGVATPSTNPGTPDAPESWFASTPGTYTNFGGLEVADAEFALLSYTPSGEVWTKTTLTEGIQEVSASIDGNVGTPEVTAEYINGGLIFTFSNMKGQTGDAAGFGTVNATVDGNIGTPGVSVNTSGPDTAKNITFAFRNLKGETGVTSVVATVDNTSGTPSCAVSLQGQQLTLAFTGLKGAQGNTGVSADYPIAIINNLTTDDPASALSAAQGVVLDGKVSQLEAEVTDLTDEIKDEIAENFNPEQRKDSLYITDQDGNVVALISADGVETTDIKADAIESETVKAPVIESETMKATVIKSEELKSEDGGFFVSDKNGYLALHILPNGKVKLNGKVNDLSKYELFSIGDSLSAANKWQPVVSQMTGCVFDAEKNEKPGFLLSIGGTTSNGGFDSAFFRAKNLIDQNVIEGQGEKAIVILENINDLLKNGVAFNPSDRTFVPTTPIEGYTMETLANIPSGQRSLNSILRLESAAAYGKKLTITNAATSEGDITLTIVTNGTRVYNYNFHITTGMSRADIAELITETYFANVTDDLGQDGYSVVFGSELSLSVSFTDTDSTGVTATVEDSAANTSSPMWYKGASTGDADWTNAGNWVNEISFSSAYKSIIELLLRTYPKIHIFLGYFPFHSVNPSSYLLPNGVYDSAAYYNTQNMEWMRNYKSVFESIARYYSIPYINVVDECGISISNISEYYYNSNLHPKNVGYEKFGEVVANNIMNNIKNF